MKFCPIFFNIVNLSSSFSNRVIKLTTEHWILYFNIFDKNKYPFIYKFYHNNNSVLDVSNSDLLSYNSNPKWSWIDHTHKCVIQNK